MKNLPTIIGVGILLILGAQKMGETRSIRNKNLLNIEHNNRNNWVGQIGNDGRFSIFSAPEYSIRATIKILEAYKQRGLDTINSIIPTWAPPSENDTQNYIDFVVKDTGINPDKQLSTIEYDLIIAAMSQMEGGKKATKEIIALGRSLV